MPFGIGPGELIIVLVIALLVLVPDKLPDVGSALGKSIREFRKAATDVQEAASLDPVPPASTPASQPAQDAAAAAQPVASAQSVASAVGPAPSETPADK